MVVLRCRMQGPHRKSKFHATRLAHMECNDTMQEFKEMIGASNSNQDADGESWIDADPSTKRVTRLITVATMERDKRFK